MKRALSLIVFAVSLGFSAAASHIPTAPDGVVEAVARTAVFLAVDDFDIMLDVRGMWEDDDFEFRHRSVMLGTYWRAHKNLKVGAFYRLQGGARHDDDWLEEAGAWFWEDTRNRFENLLIVDASPRFLLDFLPGENWVLMIKNRYLYNTYNGHQTIKIRPGLSWFWIRDRAPVLNASLAYEAYLPLNFGDTLIYEQWIYAGLLYHLTTLVKTELTLARRRVTWSPSEEFDDLEPGEDYSVDYKSFVVGLGVLVMLEK
jgi:hypothetical protein